MDDRFEELRTYVAIVEHGGINAAAAAMGIARSAPSRRLAELEQRLGITLIERGRRRFEVTAVGRDYLGRAKALLAALAEMDEPHRASQADERVAVATDAWLAAGLVAPALATFRLERTGIGIDLIASSAGGHDLAITAGELTNRAGTAREVGAIAFVTCASPTYLRERPAPTTKAGLAGLDGIHIDEPGLAWRSSVRDAPAPRPAMRVPDLQSALAAAIAGAGVAQLPDFIARDAVATGALTPLPASAAPPPLTVWISAAPDASGAALALADHLVSALAPSLS